MGIFLAFGSGVSYAFYVLYYTKSGLSRLDPYKLSLYLSVLSVAGFFGRRGGGTDDSSHAVGRALTVGFSFMVSVLATVFFQMGARLVGPEKASLLSTFEPLTSVLAGTAFFGEKLTGKSLCGIACILCGVFLLAVGRQKKYVSPFC